MKKTKQIFATIIIVISSFAMSYGQIPISDSIHIRIDDKMEVSLVSYDTKELAVTVEKDLKNMQSIVSSNSDKSKYTSLSISYIPDKSLSTKQSEPVEIIILEDGKQVKYSFNNRCDIIAESYNLQIRYNNIEDLLSGSLQEQIKIVLDSISATEKRYVTINNFIFNGQKLTENNQTRYPYGSMDCILLKAGAGASLIKNQPITDISAELALGFSKKGILKNEFYVSDNMFFNFDADQKTYSNNFLNIGYRYNLSNSNKTPNWIGIEAGYLIGRHGDFFEKNTFKFGFNWEVGKYMSVSPQLYFSGDMTKMYPGLRLGFGF
jgi:hypothetical protein